MAFLYNLNYASYLPTIAATVFEWFLVLLATHVMVLFPSSLLQRGRDTAARTLVVNYDRIPPHLQKLNAIKLRNYSHVILSVTMLMANALAVALGGLLYKDKVEYQSTGDVLLKGSEKSEYFNAFNATPMIGGDNLFDAEDFFAGVGEKLGFKQRLWTS